MMHTSDVDTLKRMTTVATAWRTNALEQGATMTQINFHTSDGSPVVLAWDLDAGEWRITVS